MRRRRSLIAGIVCGIACVAAILLYAQELNAEVEEERAAALARFGGEQVEALVATEDIAAGEFVDAGNSEKRLWIGELLPQDAVLDLESVEGKALSTPIYAGEVISARRFSEGESPALQVPEGMCAVSVPSRSVSAVGGSVKAGSMVDVYATSGTATDRIASSVLVLSTSATSLQDEGAQDDISWVTLAVAPELVEELIAAAQKTELYFSIPFEEANDMAPDAEDEEAWGLNSEEGDERAESEGAVEGESGSRDSVEDADDGADGDAASDDDDSTGDDTSSEASASSETSWDPGAGT